MSSFVISQLSQDYFFKVPEIKTNGEIIPRNIRNFLLCDSSGSMSSYWSKVVKGWNKLTETLDGSISIILFSDCVYKYPGKTLPPNQPYGGGTNIIWGLEQLEKEIKLYQNYDLIRVFFITDGIDSKQSSFQTRFDQTMEKYYRPTNNVEFFVFGLTNDFPVFISQAIRANIHTGRAGIPNLFWSQTCSEQEIMEEFDNIRKQNKQISKITLPISGKISPFANLQNEFYTGEWVCIPDPEAARVCIPDPEVAKTKDLPNWFECEGNVYELEINSKPTFNDLLDMFAQWIGQLQTISIKLSKDTNLIKSYAIQTKEKLEQMYKDYISYLPITSEMKTFTQRLINKEIKTKTYQYQSYLKIANDLASGVKLQFMDNVELAKQLKGVYTGKYSEKAFKLRSYDDENFENDKKIFIKILKETLPLLKDIESNERCVITLDNTLDIIRSEGFIETLQNTHSKLDFLQNIGITGNGVLLNITDAATINPWVTQIKDVTKHCAVLSTTAIEDLIDNPPANVQLTQHEQDNFVVAIQIGQGTIEKLNCVIPLFEKNVANALAPIIRSNLFQLICTYSIQKSPFTLNHNAHLGALSGLLGYLLTQPATEWRKTTINNIKHTTSVYLEREKLKKFIEILWSNPTRAVVTEIPNDEIKCESITKLLLMILVSANDKTDEQIAEVMCNVWKEYIGRIIGTKNQVLEWFSLMDSEKILEQFELPNFDSVYAHGYTVSETKKAIEKSLRSLKHNHPINLDVKLDIEKLKKEWNGGSVGNLSWKGLQVFTNSIGYEISDENIFQYVVHAIKNSGSAERMYPIESYTDAKQWIINELININSAKMREEIIYNYKLKASEKYFESFAQEHQTVLPMSKDDIITEANKLGINVSSETFDSVYYINEDNKLLLNACMAKDCPYYLHPRTDFSAHIERMKADPNFIHCFHRTIYAFKNKPINQIIENIHSGKCRPYLYANEPIQISKQILVEKYSGDVEINKDIYMAIYCI
jgi:hypothetical protein